jgi:hypothetical protein
MARTTASSWLLDRASWAEDSLQLRGMEGAVRSVVLALQQAGCAGADDHAAERGGSMSP